MKRPRRLSSLSRMIMRSLFGRPSTLMHPQRKRVYPPATRGLVQNDIARCIFCGQCQRKCPTAAILVTKDARTWQIDSLRCCSCRRCIEVCPVSCLIMPVDYWPCITNRQDGLFLISCETEAERSYDAEDRPIAAAAPYSSEGSRTGGKRGF